MTLIGAFNTRNSVIILADRQETISDYAKWDQGKIYLHEYTGQYRVAMAGAGDPDPINEIWEEIWGSRGATFVLGYSANWPPYQDVKARIVRAVHRVTKKTIFAVPREQRPNIELIWAIQPLGQNLLQSAKTGIDLFRTHKLSVNSIRTHYFTGNPVLLARYLSDMYLHNVALGAEEAEALAAYMLWEAKEYDPTVGKHSDIFTLHWAKGDISRVTLAEVDYWEQHFGFLKESLRLVPLLSCATSLTKQAYKLDLHLGQLVTTTKTLAKEQEKMRLDKSVKRSRLEQKLIKNLQRIAKKYSLKPPKLKAPASTGA